jgi:YVTN family beta-propeller protein
VRLMFGRDADDVEACGVVPAALLIFYGGPRMVLRRSWITHRAAPAGAVGLLIVGLVGVGGAWAVASSSPRAVTVPVSSGVRPIIVPITPCRLFDTRHASHVGARSTPLGAGETYTLTATGTQGQCAIPAGAVGLVLNVTALGGTAGSYLTVWPADAARPTASDLNWVAEQGATPNQVSVGLSSTGTLGQVSLYNRAGSVDLVGDVVAYLADHTFDDRYYTKSQVDGLVANAGTVNPQRVATLHWYAAGTTAAFPTGTTPQGVAYDGANMWVANWGDNTVSEIRAFDGKALATIPVGHQPRGVAFDGADIWVTNLGSNTVTKIRVSDGAVVGTYPAGLGPTGIAFDGTNMWVADEAQNAVSKIRVSDGTNQGTYPTGLAPGYLAYDGANMWVTNGGDATITKIRGTDGATLGTYPTGAYPFGVAFDGSSMWVASTDDNAITKIRVSDGANLGTYPVGDMSAYIAFDGTEMWVTNSNGNTISKL